ncbi:hypothetical protein [Saccharopolyspora sp. NPDC002686]
MSSTSSTSHVRLPTELDWLSPTCATCWDEARARRDAVEREADAQ